MPVSSLNPIPHLENWFSVLEEEHSSTALTPILSYGREQHLNAKPPSALTELTSNNRLYSLLRECPRLEEEPALNPHISCKFVVSMLGRKEERNTGTFCPLKRAPEELPVFRKDGYVQVCFLEIYSDKPHTIFFSVNILNLNLLTEQFERRKSKIGRNLLSFFETIKS